MTRFDDLDRALDAYFDLETAAPEPAGLLEDVLRGTTGRRPRAGWHAALRHLAWSGSSVTLAGQRSTRLVLLVALVALLVALVGVGVMIGSRPSSPLVADASPSPAPSAAPSTEPSASAAVPFPIADGEPWIAYTWNTAGHGSDHLYLVRPDGGDRHQVDIGIEGREFEHPDWSHDGSRIAFDRWLPDAQYPNLDRLDVWTMRPDGTDVRLLAACEDPCLQLANPAWSPDDTQIAVMRSDTLSADSWGPSAIEVIDVATGTRRTVFEVPDGTTGVYTPRWSADGTELVFGLESYTDATATVRTSAVIAVVRADGSDGDTPRIVTPTDQSFESPDWHPTEDRIIFSTSFDSGEPADRDTPTDIFEVRPDGTGLTNLTNLGLGSLRAVGPTWTPDGRQIVFMLVDGFDNAQLPAVALMDADGSNVSRLGFATGTSGRLRPTP